MDQTVPNIVAKLKSYELAQFVSEGVIADFWTVLGNQWAYFRVVKFTTSLELDEVDPINSDRWLREPRSLK